MTIYTVMGVSGSPFRPPFGSFSGKAPHIVVVTSLQSQGRVDDSNYRFTDPFSSGRNREFVVDLECEVD